jgi:hypothetical protein
VTTSSLGYVPTENPQVEMYMLLRLRCFALPKFQDHAFGLISAKPTLAQP